MQPTFSRSFLVTRLNAEASKPVQIRISRSPTQNQASYMYMYSLPDAAERACQGLSAELNGDHDDEKHAGHAEALDESHHGQDQDESDG